MGIHLTNFYANTTGIQSKTHHLPVMVDTRGRQVPRILIRRQDALIRRLRLEQLIEQVLVLRRQRPRVLRIAQAQTQHVASFRRGVGVLVPRVQQSEVVGELQVAGLAGELDAELLRAGLHAGERAFFGGGGEARVEEGAVDELHDDSVGGGVEDHWGFGLGFVFSMERNSLVLRCVGGVM